MNSLHQIYDYEWRFQIYAPFWEPGGRWKSISWSFSTVELTTAHASQFSTAADSMQQAAFREHEEGKREELG